MYAYDELDRTIVNERVSEFRDQVARRLGGEISEANAERVRKLLTKNIAAFKRLAKFSPYVAGDSFTQADCAAFVSLPLVGLASRIVLGEDLLAAGGVDWKAYVKVVGERPSAQRINADRKAEQERLAAK